MRLAGKVAIVTGAASGIGKATARLFAREGAQVVIADQNADGGQATADLIAQAGGQAISIATDVADTDQIQRMVDGTVTAYGRLDVLISNAASARVRPATELTEAEWDYTLATCLTSVYLGAKYAIPAMAAGGGGSIVNISSANGIFSNPGFSAYSAAKAGVLGLTRNLAIDYGAQNIRVNAICPGIIANERAEVSFAADPFERWAATETQVLGRYGRPEDIASVCLFLASDESSFMTGATLAVDGGLTILSPEALIRPSFRRRWRTGILRLDEQREPNA